MSNVLWTRIIRASGMAPAGITGLRKYCTRDQTVSVADTRTRRDNASCPGVDDDHRIINIDITTTLTLTYIRYVLDRQCSNTAVLSVH